MSNIRPIAAALSLLVAITALGGGYSPFGDIHWKAPVASVAALPTTGNSVGDARAENTTFSVNVWNGSAWVQAAGAIGLTGTSGRTGATGSTGLTGLSGSSGQTGNTGQTGLSGLSGATGVTGNSGSSGASGSSGNSGQSGSSGATGSSGSAGAAGASGLTGATGLSGSSGKTGATGVSGNDGSNGAAGSSGSSGKTGATGSSGATGQTGPVNNPRSEIFIIGGSNGYGSTNTYVRRFKTVTTNTGTDMTLTQSSTNGDKVVINTAGIYAITYCDSNTGVVTSNAIVISLNNATLGGSAAPTSSWISGILELGSLTGGDVYGCISQTTTLAATDTVRAQDAVSPQGQTAADDARTSLRIILVSY